MIVTPQNFSVVPAVTRFVLVLALLAGVALVVPRAPVAGADGFASVLRGGQTMHEGDSLASPNGQYLAELQTDGNFVVYSPHGALWANGRNNHYGVNRLELQNDGNLVQYLWNNYPLWATNTSAGGGAFLVMQDDGNLVLYSSSSRPLWASNTSQPAATTAIPQPVSVPIVASPTHADYLTVGQGLNEGQYLSSGTFAALLQTDGNFVLYNNGHPLWASGTNNAAGQLRLVLQDDSNLVLYTPSNQPVWSTATYDSVKLAKLALGFDGSLQLFSAGAPLWSANQGRLPLRLEVFGDSLAVQSQQYLVWVLSPYTSPSVQLQTTEFGGVAMCDFVNQIQQNPATFHPEVVELSFVGNSASPCMASVVAQGDSAVIAKYQSDLVTDIAHLESEGVPHIIVVGAPTSYSPPVVAQIRDAFAGAVTTLNDPRVTYLNGGIWINNPVDGSYSTYRACTPVELYLGVCTGPNVNGIQNNAVHFGDGTHFCDPALPNQVCTSWASGAWRYGSTMAEAFEDLYRLPHLGPLPS